MYERLVLNIWDVIQFKGLLHIDHGRQFIVIIIIIVVP